MNETPQATRGQCGLETRWLSGSVVSGWLPVCWQAGWQRDPTRMPARLPCRTPHLIQSWGSAFLRLGLARRRMSGQRRPGEPRPPAKGNVTARDEVETKLFSDLHATSGPRSRPKRNRTPQS
jgi:hypothetical protein